ncbi:MAG: hypothetical protein LBV31_02825 [Prevotellaceae bacterium]|jgi:hypothetical protein|nr:hypothetical protein [Prevotellaceae bacterium]
MKKAVTILVILAILSCSNYSKQADNSKYYTTQDTVQIMTETGVTLEYSKDDFNQMVKNHTEFFDEFTVNPDQVYYCLFHCNTDNKKNREFGSEAGQDAYYTLYAYFLKQKNGIDKYAQQRKKLIEIYSNINSLFGHFQYGGSYFGHQAQRILGYAEYAIYLLSCAENNIEKTYSITKQKDLYIKSLRQLIEDESEIDFETFGKEKIERNKELNSIVDKLDKLITDNFYLRRAQEFQYRHYEYY